MFEVLKRDGMARIGSFNYGTLKVSTPALMFVKTDRIKAPDEADVLITREEEDGYHTIVIPEYRFMDSESYLENITFIEPDLDELDDLEPKELVVINDSIRFLKHPRLFVEFIVGLRKKIGYQRLIYAPGIAAPWNLAILVYSGIDLLDTSRLVVESRNDNFMTITGRFKRDKGIDLCFCKGCSMDDEYESLLYHNYYTAIAELEMVRKRIGEGNLREHIELIAMVDDWSVSALRHLDLRFYEFQERYYPVSAKPDFRLRASSQLSLLRPDIVRFRKKMAERYRRPPSAEILLLVPCSAKKPYFRSKTHKMIGSALQPNHARNLLHKVVITSPLGLVPMELELFYPAQHYEIPVTGDWSADERTMLSETLWDFLGKNQYEGIIVHLGAEENIVRDVLGELGCEAQFTVKEGDAISQESLEGLSDVIQQMSKNLEPTSKRIRLIDDMRSVARFQFGEIGGELLDNAEVKGVYPQLRIFKGGKQVGMLSTERGMISLTLEGARILAKEKCCRVEIEDFQPQSTVFAIGVVAADDGIRIGDEVVVVHNSEVRGVGTAVMNPLEMVESDRGVAVKVRHHK